MRKSSTIDGVTGESTVNTANIAFSLSCCECLNSRMHTLECWDATKVQLNAVTKQGDT